MDYAKLETMFNQIVKDLQVIQATEHVNSVEEEINKIKTELVLLSNDITTLTNQLGKLTEEVNPIVMKHYKKQYKK